MYLSHGLATAPRCVVKLGQAGDPVEVQAASSVFRKEDGEEPLIIGSVSAFFSFPQIT